MDRESSRAGLLKASERALALAQMPAAINDYTTELRDAIKHGDRNYNSSDRRSTLSDLEARATAKEPGFRKNISHDFDMGR